MTTRHLHLDAARTEFAQARRSLRFAFVVITTGGLLTNAILLAIALLK